MVRRKHRLDFLEPALFRHHLSFDFIVPDDAPHDDMNRHYVPLTFLTKAPGSLFRFDLRDAMGVALPLPTRNENAQLSAAVLQHLGAKLLTAGGEKLTGIQAQHLRFIAHAERRDALGIIVNDWMTRTGNRRKLRLQKPSEDWKGTLAKNDDFWWLLRALASSSIVMVPVPAQRGDRVLIKFSYDELTTDFTQGDGFRRFSHLRALTFMAGFRSYLTTVLVSWASAQSFHFEAHAPQGLAIIDAGLSARPALPLSQRHVHLYDGNATKSRILIPHVRLRLDGTAIGAMAALSALAITALLWLAWHFAKHLAGTELNAAPSVLLLVPGLIASYLARPTHPITARMVTLVRVALVIVAVTAFAAAARLSVVSKEHPLSYEELRGYFWVLFLIATGGTFVLMLNRIAVWGASLLVRIRARISDAKPHTITFRLKR